MPHAARRAAPRTRGVRGRTGILKKEALSMDMQKMLKQARKMQQQLEDVQEGLKDVTVEATAGGGMVKAVMNGAGELQGIVIDPQALDPEDVELLQDMIVAAVNECSASATEVANTRMGAITGGMNIPGMGGFGF